MYAHITLGNAFLEAENHDAGERKLEPRFVKEHLRTSAESAV
jgi:hypothetical protein